MSQTLDEQLKAYYKGKEDTGERYSYENLFDIIGGVFDLITAKIAEQKKIIENLGKAASSMLDAMDIIAERLDKLEHPLYAVNGNDVRPATAEEERNIIYKINR